MNILHFLLENTVFQNVLQDLQLNVLYIENGCKHQQTIENIHPKCMFIANSFEEGELLFQRTKPHIIIMYVTDYSQIKYIKNMYTLQSTFIVIWDQQITKEFTDVLALGIRNIVIAPVTPQAVLEEVNKSLYQLSLVRQVSLQQELLQTMFDFQNDLLFIVEDDEIVDCNTNFLTFFGYENLFAYREQHLVFAEHFIRENGYYSTTHDITWLDDTLSSGRRIKMLNYEGTVSTFLLRATPLPEDLSRFIVKCTEITELDEIYQEQERLAMIDSLTEIYNRLKFQQILEVEWEKVIRTDEKIAIILFDIDNFKTVNDTYGHDFGDLALIQLAELMKSKVEQQHVFARWGGEEFIILVTNTVEKEAFQVAESLRFFIETKQFTGISKLTASFGVALYEQGTTREELMQRADIALYEAKKNGKNQVCVYRKEKM
ncbi:MULTISPECIES: GGDEF domain-containing protein [Bacillus]|uniref:Diguanylate cyclase (GGDEF) domain-containing protein n=2 Tax=Bacillus cereus group TaxID=86661 RepID=A0A9W5K5T2_BACC8|nr:MULTISPECIES: GGDEF domain-containing protein [Bacillus]AMR04169.1 diguanylate cyclase [Bacillus thuringiensis]AYF83113.1 GGDEF domain-containing protein [Bacillus thuringiensis]EEM82195.1 Sensory box/GGDEF family protein [Bacillus thuringiensis serovar huazhongensis BGSC 4BD1]EJR19876.1 diguanylate cyclase (GGDEF) domain-containing protein [Bacillus cereus VD014]EJR85044.1 diguanylate cyclase (GGDEF) domain-containing protein [Bacillus cereus VD156]